MKVERMDVMAFTITDVDRLDPIRVMIENYEPGKGRITITCFGKAWTTCLVRSSKSMLAAILGWNALRKPSRMENPEGSSHEYFMSIHRQLFS